MHYPTQADLLELFDYKQAALYYRKAPLARRRTGDMAGSVDRSTGYRIVKINGVRYREHRLIWVYVYGALPLDVIDHINGSKADNRLINLRAVSQQKNMQNQSKPTTANKTGVLGVYWSTKRQGFMAQISLNEKKKRRGPYKTIERAGRAYIELKRIHHEGCTI